MLFRQLALAATAVAFFVVPEISEHDENIFKALPIEAEPFQLPQSALRQSISVPCQSCEDSNAELLFNFAIDDGKRLVLNDFEIYPDPDPWSGDLQATVRGTGQKNSKTLGYSIAVMPLVKSAEDHMEGITVDVRVIEVDNVFIDNIPLVRVQLIKAPTNEILIGSLSLQSDDEACSTMFCRAKDAFKEIIDSIKALGGCDYSTSSEDHLGLSEEPGLVDEWADDQLVALLEASNDYRGDWQHLVKSVAAHIFLPILMGITAGIGVAWYVYCIPLALIDLQLTTLALSCLLEQYSCISSAWCVDHAENSRGIATKCITQMRKLLLCRYMNEPFLFLTLRRSLFVYCFVAFGSRSVEVPQGVV